MDPRRGIKKFCHKIKDRFKGRPDKKSSNCYWPEFTSYCGCCNLSTGIYIRSIITLIISIFFLTVNGAILNYLVSLGPVIYNANLTAIDDYIATDREKAESDQATLKFIYKSFLAYSILWICFKIIYILTVIFTVYAIFRKNPWMLKVLLYISIPNMILDFFISFIGTVLLSDGLKIALVICNLSEGYNILAINSEYKRMRGKSRLSVEDREAVQRTEQIYVNSFITEQRERYYNRQNQSHCRSCSCYLENVNNIVTTDIRSAQTISSYPALNTVNELNNITANSTNTTVSNIANSNVENFNGHNDPAIVSSQHGGLPSDDTVTSIDVRDVRSNTLGLKAEGKVDISDIPFIYELTVKCWFKSSNRR